MGKTLKYGICKFCGDEGKLVDSHIIPRAFYEEIKAHKNSYVIMKTLGEKDSRSRIGIYDQFLCLGCEKKVGKWDQYGVEYLLVSPFWPREPIYDEYEVGKNLSEHFIGYGLNPKKYDYIKLKMFFISLLWRISVSSRSLFSDIKLPSLIEKKAKEMIVREEPHDENVFTVMISAFSDYYVDGVNISRCSLNTIWIGDIGENFFLCLKLSKLFIRIKLSSGEVHEDFRLSCLSPHRESDLFVVEYPFEESQTYQDWIKLGSKF